MMRLERANRKHSMMPEGLRQVVILFFLFVWSPAIGQQKAEVRSLPTTIDSTLTRVLWNHHRSFFIAVSESRTDIVRIHDQTRDVIASLPVQATAVDFAKSGQLVYILHPLSRYRSRLICIDLMAATVRASRNFSSRAFGLSVSANDSTVAVSERRTIKALNAADLTIKRVHWEASIQGHLAFNPAAPEQIASANTANVIQVRNLAADTLITEMKAHRAPVQWIEYDRDGKHLLSVDAKGKMLIWSVNNQQVLLYDSISAQAMTQHWRALWNSDVVRRKLPQDIIDSSPGDPKLSIYFDKTPVKPIQIFPQPALGYTPETGFFVGLGANVQLYPKKISRYPPYYWPSNVTPTVIYGFNGNQWRTDISYNFYNPSGWQFSGQVNFNVRERNYFFGIGNSASKDDSQQFKYTTFSATGTVLRNISQHVLSGVAYNFRYNTSTTFKDDEVVEVTGTKGGRLAGIGPIIRFDFRNDMTFPDRGFWVEGRMLFYHDNITSEYNYKEVLVDGRKYFPIKLARMTSVLALQGMLHATWDGDVPFYQLPYITGDRALRGVWRNLYIDRQVAFVQAEYRSFILPGDTRFGYVVFAGVGDSANNFAKNYDSNPTVAYGVGYRQQLVPKLRVDFRIDFAMTNKDNFGVYGGVGVGF